MDAAAELGRNPVSKHQIQPEYGDEQADAGRDGWTRLARPNSQARHGDRGILLFPVQLTTSRIGDLTRLIQTAICDDHTYIHTYIHVGEVWLILPTKRNSRLLTLHERPRAVRCQWTKRPGVVLLPGRRCWFCLALYLGFREGDVGAFWLVIFLGQVVGIADSVDALTSNGGHVSVAAGFVLLDAAVGIVMGGYLVI